MTLKSMTGFARVKGEGAGHNWYWELKSVNAKGLDVRCRVPSFLDGFDVAVKKYVNNALNRGSVYVNLDIDREQTDDRLKINHSRLASLIEAAKNAPAGAEPARLDGLLSIKGVVEIDMPVMDEETRKKLENLLLESLREAVATLINARASEGERTAVFLNEQMDTIESLVQDAEQSAGARLENIQDRLRQNVAKLLEADPPVSEDRLAQEVALLAVKADVREEIDRLKSHIIDARELLASGKPVGRRLDFQAQEFNREANTLCSKSGDKDLTKTGLDLKVTIDQFREQIQNIE